MKLVLEKYSYRSSEELFNSRATIRREIENILLKPGKGGIVSGWSEGLEVQYELHSFSDFDYFLERKRVALTDQS